MTHPLIKTMLQSKQDLIQSKLDLRQHLLANFCDGDSWEAADATSLTKHGALHVAEYFFLLGVEMAEGVVPESVNPTLCGECNLTGSLCRQCYSNRNFNRCRIETLAAIKEMKEGLGKESV